MVKGPALQVLEHSSEGRELNARDTIADVGRDWVQVIMNLERPGRCVQCVQSTTTPLRGRGQVDGAFPR